MPAPAISTRYLSNFPQAVLQLAVLALACASSASAADTIGNPFPEPITKSDIRINLEPVAKGLASPVLAVPVPDRSGRLCIVDQAGKIFLIEGGKLLPTPLLDVSDRLVELNKDFDERGLLGLAFDPGYSDPSSPGYLRLFTYTSEPTTERTDFPNPHAQGAAANHQSVIAAWKVSTDGSRVDPGSRKELMRIDQPQFNHNGGMIAFGPDGFLYIGMGDGGGANDIGPGHNPEIGNSQDSNVVLGKMLRIDVNGSDSRNGAYGIPKDNPFAAGGGAAEIYALGLRNPFRFSFDGPKLIVGDVGQNKMEMVYDVTRGGNYGWRVKEGSFKFNINGTIEKFTSDHTALVDPVLQYDRDEGTSVMGGYIYRGKAIPALNGLYVFGDYQKSGAGTGRLFVGDLAGGKLQEFRIGTDDGQLGFLLKGFGQDLDGELYAVGSAQAGPSGTGGVVVKIVPAE